MTDLTLLKLVDIGHTNSDRHAYEDGTEEEAEVGASENDSLKMERSDPVNRASYAQSSRGHHGSTCLLFSFICGICACVIVASFFAYFSDVRSTWSSLSWSSTNNESSIQRLQNPTLSLPAWSWDATKAEARLSAAPGSAVVERFYNLIRPHYAAALQVNFTKIGGAQVKLEGIAGPHLLYHARPAPLNETDRAVVSVEGRENADLVLSVLHTIYLLGDEWGVVLFVDDRNRHYFEVELHIYPGGWGEFVRLVVVDSGITHDTSNALPMSSVFYDAIGTEHLVVIQSDSILLRSTYLPGLHTSDRLTRVLIPNNIYMGAPWNWCGEEWCRWGGNGISYRRTSVMRKLIHSVGRVECDSRQCNWFTPFTRTTWQEDHRPMYEDVYITKVMYERRDEFQGLVMNNPELMSEYGMETVDYGHVTPYFVHKIWAYLPTARVSQLLAVPLQYYYPEH